jgi:NADPH:quinone reductase-like Zn-dependent oxidoreductase
MITNRSYQLQAGRLSNLRVAESPLPPPGPGEVSVAVRAIGLNFADIFVIWGLYGATPKGVFTPGLEYAGEVIALGEGVQGLSPGMRVMGVTRFGGYTTHINIDARYVLALPEDWTYEQGAAYLVQVLTAYYGLKTLGDAQRGDAVLIHSAAGGVGLWAGRIARQLDCYTIGTVGHSAKLDFLRAHESYDRLIVRRPAYFRQDLLEALDGRPLRVVMECIGGKIFQTGFELLAPQGRAVVYGSARYGSAGDRPNYPRMLWLYLTRPKIDPQKLPEKNKAVLGFNLIYLYEQAELMHRLLDELRDMRLPAPHVGHTFPFAELPAAIRLFQSGKTIGKVVVTVPD